MTGNYFDNKNKEFVIRNMYPRRAWQNYFWNDETLGNSNQFGCGRAFSTVCGDKRNIESGDRHVYVKNRKTGEYYSATRNFTRLPFDLHECHVGLGYQKIISEYDGVRTEFTITVPKEGNAVQYFVKVQNLSDEKKELDVYFYNQPTPALSGHESYGKADYNEQVNGLVYSHVAYDVKMPYTHLYLSSEEKFHAYDVYWERFCGIYNTLVNPVALSEDCLASKGVSYGAYIGALQYRLTLGGGESFQTAIACGMARSERECEENAKLYATTAAFEQSLQAQKTINGAYTGTFVMQSDDEYMNSQVNVWLKRQISLGKTWGRLYGKGFRDTLQDLTAFVSFDTPFARERLLHILKHMFEDGNTIRMFEPNFRYPYNDGATWIPAAVLGYINESGDLDVLAEKIPYIKGNTQENTRYAESVAFEDYTKISTSETYSVFDHLQRAMDYLYGCRGKRGLVLLLGGDWNDSLNAAGKLGKGEGVWLTIATIKAYNEFIEILKIAKKEELISTYLARRDELKACVMKYGYENGKFIYCYNDYDEKIGSEENAEGKIFLNPQTWATLANIAEKKTLEKAMDEVENYLVCDFGYKQCYPAFTKGNEHIGRISYFLGGNVENASVYNHGVAFKAVADCLLGRGDAAYKTLKMISYDNPKNLNSGVEPYAVSNMYLGPDNAYLTGYAPHSWITGTAGWIYRCITEYICGIQPTYEGLKISPCFPSHWNKLKVTRKFRGVTYNICFERKGKSRILVNDKEILGNIIPLQKGENCEVIVQF